MIDCLLNSLLFTNPNDIANCLMMNKQTTSLNNNFLWKSLCERDLVKFDDNYYEEYKKNNMYEFFNMDFQYGRIYQLVIDKSKIVPNVQGRKYQIIDKVNRMLRQEIIEEGLKIIKNNKNSKKSKYRPYNEFINFKISMQSNFENEF